MGWGWGHIDWKWEEGAWALGEGEWGWGGAKQATSGLTAAYSSQGAEVRGFLLLSFLVSELQVNIFVKRGKLRELWAIQSLGNEAGLGKSYEHIHPALNGEKRK